MRKIVLCQLMMPKHVSITFFRSIFRTRLARAAKRNPHRSNNKLQIVTALICLGKHKKQWCGKVPMCCGSKNGADLFALSLQWIFSVCVTLTMLIWIAFNENCTPNSLASINQFRLNLFRPVPTMSPPPLYHPLPHLISHSYACIRASALLLLFCIFESIRSVPCCLCAYVYTIFLIRGEQEKTVKKKSNPRLRFRLTSNFANHEKSAVSSLGLVEGNSTITVNTVGDTDESSTDKKGIDIVTTTFNDLTKEVK